MNNEIQVRKKYVLYLFFYHCSIVFIIMMIEKNYIISITTISRCLMIIASFMMFQISLNLIGFIYNELEVQK